MTYKIPILLYHDLESPDCPNEKSDLATRGTVVNADMFEEQIRYLVKNGYESISIKDYFDIASYMKSIPPQRIILTFDDGHHSNYRLAFPILKKYGFKATFFIIADRVDQDHHLTRGRIKEMADAGMEIGSHGLTHRYLPLLDHKEIEHEVCESKKILESIMKQPVDYFAFPGGHYNRDSLNLLAHCGYKGACSCLQGLNDLKTNSYLLKRIELRRRFSIDEFRHIFNPAHIAFYKSIDLWKGFIRRSIGLDAYSRLRSRLYNHYIFKR